MKSDCSYKFRIDTEQTIIQFPFHLAPYYKSPLKKLIMKTHYKMHMMKVNLKKAFICAWLAPYNKAHHKKHAAGK